jgi:predicted dinucleotide-binding enzyme
MNIGIIGTGDVGSALGRLWAGRGHAIMFGSRDPQSARVRALLATIGTGARAGSAREATQFGAVVVLATPFHATEAAIRGPGAGPSAGHDHGPPLPAGGRRPWRRRCTEKAA